MSKLIISYNGIKESEIELDKEIITIGRRYDNDIAINSSSVSGEHAKILTIVGDSFLEDLGSTNGTIINGQSVSKQALKNGDLILIGDRILSYNTEEDEVGEFEQTMIIRPDTKGMPETGEADAKIGREVGRIAAGMVASGVSKDAPVQAKLCLKSGTNSGKELKLVKIITTFGKPGVQVAAITRRPKGYFLVVVDPGKTGGTSQVNGEIVGKDAFALKNGDIIEVAGTTMAFYLEASE